MEERELLSEGISLHLYSADVQRKKVAKKFTSLIVAAVKCNAVTSWVCICCF